MSSPRKILAGKVCAFNHDHCREVPSIDEVKAWVDTLVDTLFPIRLNSQRREEELEVLLADSEAELERLLLTVCRKEDQDMSLRAAQFFSGLPVLFDQLAEDARAITRFDPASECLEEVLLSYPGFYAITIYRLAHALHRMGTPLLPRVMTEHAHSRTGIDINPGARIASPFFIDHGTGIVIGETAVIGKHVKVYQGVTLGALTVEKGLARTKRHPTIEDHVVIYAGSTILGGDTVIGHHTVVGGNTWITESILPHSVVYRNHRVVVRDGKDFKPPIDYVI